MTETSSPAAPVAVDPYQKDTLVNLQSGLGTEKDKSVYTTWAAVADLDHGQLDAAYRHDGFARKIVDIPPDDSTREWRHWQAEAKQIALIEKEERRLGLPQKVRYAMQMARLHGGAAIILGTDDSGDPAKPLDIEKVKQGGLKFITALTRQELATGSEMDRDPMSEFYGWPKSFNLNTPVVGQVPIHPSRVIRFIGMTRPNVLMSTDGWGDSVVQIAEQALKDAGVSAASVAALLHEMKLDVIGVPDLMANLSTAEYTARLTERFRIAGNMKSMFNMLLKDSEETWETRQLNMTGLGDIVMMFLQILSGIADIPVTRLLGTSPKGMNATGESDIRNYYDRIKSDQKMYLTPALDRLDEAMIRSALGSRPDEVHYIWAPLWQMTEKEKAEVSKMKADAFKVDVDSAIIPADALAKARVNQLVEDGVYPGLEEAIEESDQELGLIAENEEKAAKEFEQQLAQMEARRPPPAANANAKAKRAADTRFTDASPRTLYVRRDVVNAAQIKKWAKVQGIEVDNDPLHVTLAYSKVQVDWMKVGEDWAGDDKTGNITIRPGGPRVMEYLGNDLALVLSFTSSRLSWRHEDIKRMTGAAWDYDTFQPHITLRFDAPPRAPMDLATIEPWRGAIILGPEVFEEIKAK